MYTSNLAARWNKLPLVFLEGYKCFHVKASSSSHGGLITYIDDKFDVKVVKTIDNSSLWEGLFIEWESTE